MLVPKVKKRKEVVGMKVVSCSADDRLANKWTQALHQVTDVFRTNAPATLEAHGRGESGPCHPSHG